LDAVFAPAAPAPAPAPAPPDEYDALATACARERGLLENVRGAARGGTNASRGVVRRVGRRADAVKAVRKDMVVVVVVVVMGGG